jgi:hypothetical protein
MVVWAGCGGLRTVRLVDVHEWADLSSPFFLLDIFYWMRSSLGLLDELAESR